MPDRLRRGLIPALLAGLIAVAPTAQPGPLDSLAQAYAAEHTLPSLVLAVSVAGERTVVGAGAVDGAAPNAESVYEIGSISKVLTALALADAVTRGEVSLDTPVRDLLPDSAMAAQHESGPIRLWHLATHTSGLPRIPLEMGFQTGFDMSDPYARYAVTDLYASLDRPRAETAPGETSAYSNLAVGLLGHALAHRAGTTYGTLVATRILDPLGMRATTLAVPDTLQPGVPRGHSVDGEPVPYWTFQESTAGAGGFRSTATDLLTFGEAVLDPGAPLADAVALTLTPRFDLGNERAIGLGWHLGPVPGADARMAQHSGGTGGFRSFFAVVPEARVVVVAFTNQETSVDPLGRDVLRHLLRDRVGADEEE